MVISWRKRRKPRPYRIRMRKKAGTCVGLDFDSADTTNSSEFLSVRDTKLEVKSLQPWTSVLIKVSRMPGLGVNCFTTKVARPSRPLHLKAVERHGTKLVLTWRPPRNPNGPVDLYHAIVKKETQDAGTAPKEREISGTETKLSLLDLEPWTEYWISIHAANIDKELKRLLSAPTEIRARTAIGAPSPPRNVSLTTSERGFNATFQRPEVFGGPEETLGYLCTVVESNNTSARLLLIKVREQECGSNLEPYVEYSLSLQAYQKNGLEELYSEKLIVHFMTLGHGPGPVRQLEADCKANVNSVNVTWVMATPSGGLTTGVFILNIVGKNVTDDGDYITRTVHVYPNETCQQYTCAVLLKDLLPNYNYEIGVEARNLQSEDTSERVATQGDCVVSPSKGDGHHSSCSLALIFAAAMFSAL